MKEFFEGKLNITPNTTNSTDLVDPSNSAASAPRPHLNHGAIAGIALGCTAAIIGCAIGATYIAKRKSKTKKTVGHSNNLLRIPFSEPQLGELSAGRKSQEIMDQYRDRVEFPGTSRRPPVEMSAGALPMAELSTIRDSSTQRV